MFYTVLVISLAMAAPEISHSCYEYCQSQNFYSPQGDLPSQCDCSAVNDNIASAEFPTLPVDDTGVYFLPAEEHPFQKQLKSHPFIISNPINIVPKSKSRIKKEFDSDRDFSEELSENIESNEKTETFIHINSGQEASPSYLDLEIEAGRNSNIERSSIAESSLIEDFESTERTLTECLDLHIVDYTRKYGSTEKIKEYWESKNLKIYDHLSNFDLIEKMREYCSHPKFIFEQSFHDIKKGVPKKNTNKSIRYVEDHVGIVNRISDANEFNVIPSEFTDPAHFTSWTSIHEDVTETPSVFDQYSNYYDSMTNDTKITETIYKDLPELSSLDSLAATTAVTTETIRNSDVTSYIEYNNLPNISVMIMTTKNIENVNESENDIATRQKGLTEKSMSFDLDIMPSEKNFRMHNPINGSDFNVPNNELIVNEMTTLSSHVSMIRSEESTSEIDTQNTEKNASDTTVLSEGFTSINDIATTPVPAMFTGRRILYTESDIKIPKIITKECINKTIQSTINDYEKIPNNDFKNLHKESQLMVLQNSTVNSDKNNGKDLKPFTDPKSIISNNTILNGREYDITGNLYFASSQELVPVRLLQTDSGKVSLGIDGESLCDKLFKNNNVKSILLTTLCDCVKHNKCKYNNVTVT